MLKNSGLDISGTRTIKELQQDFNKRYPYLKLEFYKTKVMDQSVKTREQLPHSTLLKMMGVRKDGVLTIPKGMTVEELEDQFLRQFGLLAQVSRRSGNIWLETTMTDNWSLEKQNEYGREITLSRQAPDNPALPLYQ